MKTISSVRLSRRAFAFGVASLGMLASCGQHHHLAEYTFADRSLGLVYIAPPSPVLYTGSHGIRADDDPVTAVMRVGAGVVKEVEARKANARLDSANARLNVADVLARRTVERAGRYLGMRSVGLSEPADFVLEIQMRNFGIDVSGASAAYLYTNAEAVLLERRTGREIWSAKVHGTDRLTPAVYGASRVPGTIITAGTLNTVSVADFQAALDQLATLSSTVIADQLRAALRDARR
ncbi:MAG: hypothetical protein ACJ8AD_05705 [Gemmatimonadaceae bacterium]